MKEYFLIFLLVIISSCTFSCKKQLQLTGVASKNQNQIAEESKALTTAALDAVNLAPVNPPTDLAKQFLQKDQQLEGFAERKIQTEK